MNEYSCINPIMKICDKDNSLYLSDPLTIKKINNLSIKSWTCCICSNDINKPSIKIVYPFKCDHSICFKCFDSWCRSIKQSSERIKIRCPLCRNKVDDNWILCPKIKTKFYNQDNIQCSIIVPYFDHI